MRMRWKTIGAAGVGITCVLVPLKVAPAGEAGGPTVVANSCEAGTCIAKPTWICTHPGMEVPLQNHCDPESPGCR
jgi:hypothetical protein